MPDSYLYIAEEADAGLRFDVFLCEQDEFSSRSFAQKLIESGGAILNGQTVKPSVRIKKGDEIRAVLPQPTESAVEPENIPLDIVYEDADLIVVNKPVGMVVHPAPGHFSGTLVNALMYHCKDGLSGINGVLRPGIVHRIDRDTSGLLVVAKTDSAHVCLSRQLAEHSMMRVYKALCWGVVKAETGTIDAPLGRHPKDRKRMAVVKDGRRAVTHFSVIERFKDFTHIECRLETGRTHQIRVHMAHINHPLIGDTVYAQNRPPRGFSGQALHAETLGFVHPNGEYIEFKRERKLI